MVTRNNYRTGLKDEVGTYGNQNPLKPFLPDGIVERKNGEVIFVELSAVKLLRFRCSTDRICDSSEKSQCWRLGRKEASFRFHLGM